MRRNFVLGSVGLILVFGLLAHVLVRSSLSGRIDEALDERIAAEGALLDRSFRLEALDLTEQVRDRAATSAAASVFTARDEGERRARAHDAANKIADWFRDPSRRGKLGRPDVVVITDRVGKVVARDRDPNRMFGEALSSALPMLASVLEDGRAESDVWSHEGQGLVTQQVAAAPIRDDRGVIRGALVVGYGLTDGAVAAHAKLLGRDLAFVVDGKVVAASLPRAAVTALEKALAESSIAGSLDRLEARSQAPRFEVSLAGQDYVGLARALPRAESTPVTAVLLASRADADRLTGAVGLIWPLTVAFAIIALVFAWIMVNSVLIPVSAIEEGVLAIINGNVRHRIELEDSELGGLAYRINQLVSVFAGETGGAASTGEGWGSLDSTLSHTSSQSGAAPLPTDPVDDPEVAAALAAEPEDAYLSRVFREYAAAKRSLGEDIGQISEAKFGERIQGSARAMGQKHGCAVRFRVEQSAGRVILRPVLLRETAS